MGYLLLQISNFGCGSLIYGPVAVFHFIMCPRKWYLMFVGHTVIPNYSGDSVASNLAETMTSITAWLAKSSTNFGSNYKVHTELFHKIRYCICWYDNLNVKFQEVNSLQGFVTYIHIPTSKKKQFRSCVIQWMQVSRPKGRNLHRLHPLLPAPGPG